MSLGVFTASCLCVLAFPLLDNLVEHQCWCIILETFNMSWFACIHFTFMPFTSVADHFLFLVSMFCLVLNKKLYGFPYCLLFVFFCFPPLFFSLFLMYISDLLFAICVLPPYMTNLTVPSCLQPLLQTNSNCCWCFRDVVNSRKLVKPLACWSNA